MIDRFARLRHHAVVCRDDEHDDVGDFRAAGAHQRERFVARRVEKHDVPAGFRGDVIRADVLRNAAGLALGDAGRPDGVEQRRLAVIDVAHDRHDRGARNRVFRPHFFGFHFEHVLLERAELHFGSELTRDHRRRLGVNGAVDRHHHALVEQLLEHVLHALLELVGEILDGHAFDERHGAGDRRRSRGCRRLRTHVAALARCRAGVRRSGASAAA